MPSSHYKGSPVCEFQGILFLNNISTVIFGETQEFIVERDHGPPTGCAASFRWGIVTRAAQSQAPESHPALAELCRLYWSPLCVFAWLRGLLREEVGHNVSEQAETDEEIHALCEALIASEGRSDP